jgi:PTH1 family peptidyl-tRNA hydrolase
MEKIILCGLGNPGPKYARNRHNIGFRVVEEIANQSGASFQDKKKYQIADFDSEGYRIYILKPLEFMNLSGNALSEITNLHKIEPTKIIVFHDELDIPFGSIKTKLGGGSAGHNGLKSITERLGSQEFARIRLGVGKPPMPGPSISDWVLQNFSEEEERSIPSLISQAIEKWKVWFYEIRKRSN